MDYRKTERGFTLRLDRSEEIVSTLSRFLAERDLAAGALSGIGAVDEAELGLFNMAKKEYLRRRFEGEFEIVALTGNVTLVQEQPFCHIHALLSDEEFRVIGGHLFGARVSVTCEIDLSVHAEPLRRSQDARTTLMLIDFEENGHGLT